VRLERDSLPPALTPPSTSPSQGPPAP
jgi:hypothetical protein